MAYHMYSNTVYKFYRPCIKRQQISIFCVFVVFIQNRIILHLALASYKRYQLIQIRLPENTCAEKKKIIQRSLCSQIKLFTKQLWLDYKILVSCIQNKNSSAVILYLQCFFRRRRRQGCASALSQDCRQQVYCMITAELYWLLYGFVMHCLIFKVKFHCK